MIDGLFVVLSVLYVISFVLHWKPLRFGSVKGVLEILVQQPNMMEGQVHPLEMATNTSESDIPRIRDDDMDTATKSGSENQEGGASGDDQDQRPKKKRYHRHTQHQIQEMEA